MPIRKGESWGGPGILPEGAPVFATDAALADWVAGSHVDDPDATGALGPVGLVGGDLCRTLGGRGDADRLRAGPATRAEIDVWLADLDATTRAFVAHLVARRRGWRGRFVVAMNAAWVGSWYLGPRAHPGDGLLDLTDGSLDLRQRLLARRRVMSGDHLPHPSLAAPRVGEWETQFPSPVPVTLDGRPAGRVRHLRLRLAPVSVVVVV